jgi:hypothetical protein
MLLNEGLNQRIPHRSSIIETCRTVTINRCRRIAYSLVVHVYTHITTKHTYCNKRYHLSLDLIDNHIAKIYFLCVTKSTWSISAEKSHTIFGGSRRRRCDSQMNVIHLELLHVKNAILLLYYLSFHFRGYATQFLLQSCFRLLHHSHHTRFVGIFSTTLPINIHKKVGRWSFSLRWSRMSRSQRLLIISLPTNYQL